MIEEDVQQELEEMEKATDIDDILGYRSMAERELEVRMMLRMLRNCSRVLVQLVSYIWIFGGYIYIFGIFGS